MKKYRTNRDKTALVAAKLTALACFASMSPPRTPQCCRVVPT